MSLNPRELRPGDAIRILDIPGRDVPGYLLFDETRALYERLIQKRTALRIHHINDLGYPYICYQLRDESGGWVYHDLMIGPDDIWERAESAAAPG